METPATERATELLRRHAALTRGRCVQYAVEAPAGCLLLASRWTPVPGWNHVIPLPDAGKTPAFLLDEAEAALAQAGIEPALYVPDLPAWASIRKEASARGFTQGARDEWMVRDLAASPVPADVSMDSITWIEPDRIANVEAFVDCFARGFENLPDGYRHQLYLTLLSGRSDGALHCAALVDGKFASVGSLYHDGTYALVLNYATDPALRGRRLGDRTRDVRLARAARDGCRIAFFQTYAALVPSFERRGFARAFTAEILTRATGER